jgi:uncharacterized membrane protein
LSLARASILTAGASLISNRVFAVAVGLWFRLPILWMLSLLIVLDIVQIPFYYWLYEHSHLILARLPASWGELFRRSPQETAIGRWTASLGGLGVMTIAALPAMGGGMWTAIFLAYGLKLDRRTSYIWLIVGSIVSYLVTYWVIDAIFAAFRDLAHYFSR